MDVDARHPARTGARADRRARAHERPGLAQRQALAGHRRGARRRDRRHLDRQHPAPREPQRLDRGAVDIRVRETFPDHVLEEADEVVLVDLTPEALQRPAARGEGLRGGARRRRARELLPRRPPLGAARARAARGRGGHRARRADGGLDPLSAAGRRRARARAGRPRSRDRSGSSAARGARPSVSARRSTRSGCGSPETSRARTSRCSSRRCGGSPSSSAPTSSRRRATTSSRPSSGSSPTAARPTCSWARRTSRAAREILRGSLVSALVRELPGVDVRVVANRADRGGARDRDRRSLPCSWSRARAGARRGARRRRRRVAPPGAGRHPRPVLRQPRPHRARGGHPDRPRAARRPRRRLPARRAAPVRRGLAAEGAGRDRAAAARGGRARSARGRRAGRRADREGSVAHPRAAAGSGRSSTSSASSRPAAQGTVHRRIHAEGAQLDPHACAGRDDRPAARAA